jgi:hypothetical protein
MKSSGSQMGPPKTHFLGAPIHSIGKKENSNRSNLLFLPPSSDFFPPFLPALHPCRVEVCIVECPPFETCIGRCRTADILFSLDADSPEAETENPQKVEKNVVCGLSFFPWQREFGRVAPGEHNRGEHESHRKNKIRQQSGTQEQWRKSSRESARKLSRLFWIDCSFGLFASNSKSLCS